MNETVEKFRIMPENTSLELLSPVEIDALFEESNREIHSLLERCALAVLNSGEETDDVKKMLEKYTDFSIEVIKTSGGIELELRNAPIKAFVSYQQSNEEKIFLVYKIIEGLKRNVFSVLRDLVFTRSEMRRTAKFDLETSAGITDSVFLILRNAGIFNKVGRHKIIVCWGGHALGKNEYDYTKQVGYQCGIRFMDIITGSGPGAMKGPMEGAAIAHAIQRIVDGRYIGITEPGIIAAEAPNALVDPLIIMPDIEKRLEAFVRLGHGIIIFPGGAGTAEELMYILGILSHPRNKNLPFPLLLTGPKSSRSYFEALDRFVRNTLGPDCANMYKIIIEDPTEVAHKLNRGLLKVKDSREVSKDSYYFNRTLFIPPIFQEPFEPTHEKVSELTYKRRDGTYKFASYLRRLFSAIVWGNVKPAGIEAVEQNGPLKIYGNPQILNEIDSLIQAFSSQKRMRLVGGYKPVYTIITKQ